MLLTTLLHHVWRKDKHLYVNYRKDDKYHDLSMTVLSLTCFIFQTGLPAGVQTVTPEAISHILTFQPDIRVHPPKEPTKETSISGNKNTLSVILIGTNAAPGVGPQPVTPEVISHILIIEPVMQI